MADSGPRPNAVTDLADPGIPTLDLVLDPVTIGKHLEQVLPDHWGPVQDIQIRILKRHRTRCTFEIAWPGGTARRDVIAKLYASDRADVYRAMEAIRRAGFGPHEAFSIPEPLAYVPELRLLIQEKVQGPSAKQVFLTGEERDRVDAAERCALWLARFQAMGPRLRPACRVDDLLSSKGRWSQWTADLGWPLTDKAARLREQLATAAQGLQPIDVCAGHGEYSCGQILLAEGRTAVLDWDGHDVADPARDAARFLVVLKRLEWKNPRSLPALAQAAAVFLQTYLARCASNVRENLPFYTAATCSYLAAKDIGHHAREKALAMLDEGLRVLAEGLSP